MILRLIFTFGLLLLVSFVNGHGCPVRPCVRGNCAGYNVVRKLPPVISGLPKTCIDYSIHFPAGDKARVPGSGLRSQKQAASGKYTLYEPTKPGFVFRSGVCGDLKNGPQHHLRGGRYYCPANSPVIAATYEQGGTLDATVDLATHHNGFMEFIVCDVKKCGGEISEACLRNGNVCRKLMRKYEPECETRTNKACPPIDPKYPTRWYLPCSKTAAKSGEVMTRIRFQLPSDLSCEHCVLQWYYAAANSCNPIGLYEYFTGPRGPMWGSCPGQGSAKGGYRPNWKTCEGPNFSEEYYACSDIRITAKGGVVVDPSPTPTQTPAPKSSENSNSGDSGSGDSGSEASGGSGSSGAKSSGSNPFKQVRILLNGSVYLTLNAAEGRTYTISPGGKKIRLDAIPNGFKPRVVKYYVQNQGRKNEYNAPYTFDFKRPVSKGDTVKVELVARTQQRQNRKLSFYLKIQ